jgi:hypothetical protein
MHVAHDLRGGRLRWDDPHLIGTGHEQVLDLAVARDDAKATELPAVQLALRGAHLEDALLEVGLEAGREAQGAGIFVTREPGDGSTAVDEVARVGLGPPPRLGEVPIRVESVVGPAAQDQPQRDVVGPDPARPAQDRLEGGLDLEGQIRRLLGGALHVLAVLHDDPQVSLADPVLAVGSDEVGGRAPDEREVLVEDARPGPPLRGARGGLHHVGDEEADVLVLAGVRQVVGRVEELDLVLRRVAPGQQETRILLRQSRGTDLHPLVDEPAKLARDLDRRHLGGLDAGNDSRRNRCGHGGVSRPPGLSARSPGQRVWSALV